MCTSIVPAAEKRTVSKLLEPPKKSEKTYEIDGHVVATVAG
jgi:20S proteasome alpha/beta subunit